MCMIVVIPLRSVSTGPTRQGSHIIDRVGAEALLVSLIGDALSLRWPVWESQLSVKVYVNGYGYGRGYGFKLGLHRSPTSLPLV